jgi:hypothetical protein
VSESAPPPAADTEAEERRRLTNLHEKMTDSFDRAVMTLAGGALAVSITFIHEVAPHPKHTKVLAWAWIFFGLSLVVILWSFLTSERAIAKMYGQIGQEDDIPRGKITGYLNWISAGAFVVGVAFLVLFAWLNL